MFATIKICFVVGRDRTPNAAAHRGERESGARQGRFNARMPCGNRGRSLADRQLYRKRPISLLSYHLCKNQPGIGRKSEPAFGRIAAPQCRPHRADQEGSGSQAKGAIKSCGQFYLRNLFATAEKTTRTISSHSGIFGTVI